MAEAAPCGLFAVGKAQRGKPARPTRRLMRWTSLRRRADAA